jgi:hypothetical protein
MSLAPAGVHYSGVSVAWWPVLSAFFQGGARVLLRTRLLSGSLLGRPAVRATIDQNNDRQSFYPARILVGFP